MTASRIDWPTVKQRLAKADQALTEALTVSDERKAEILRRRADYLASRRHAQSASVGPRTDVMTFMLGDERFAIAVKYLMEIRPLVKWVPVPSAGHEILGVMNVRGEVRAVWDLARIMNVSKTGAASFKYVMVATKDDLEIGFCVDYVYGTQKVDDALIIPFAQDGDASSFIKGIAPDKTVLLDGEAILSHIVAKRQNREVNSHG